MDGCGGSWLHTQIQGGRRALSSPPRHNHEDEESQPVRSCLQVPEPATGLETKHQEPAARKENSAPSALAPSSFTHREAASARGDHPKKCDHCHHEA